MARWTEFCFGNKLIYFSLCLPCFTRRLIKPRLEFSIFLFSIDPAYCECSVYLLQWSNVAYNIVLVDASKVFRNFIVALNEVHEKADMIIGDIKLENLCLLDSSDRFPIKIIDFGMSFPLLSRQEHFDARKLGTACYLAPETLKSLKESRPSEAVYSRATDIFQAGSEAANIIFYMNESF